MAFTVTTPTTVSSVKLTLVKITVIVRLRTIETTTVEITVSWFTATLSETRLNQSLITSSTVIDHIPLSSSAAKNGSLIVSLSSILKRSFYGTTTDVASTEIIRKDVMTFSPSSMSLSGITFRAITLITTKSVKTATIGVIASWFTPIPSESRKYLRTIICSTRANRIPISS